MYTTPILKMVNFMQLVESCCHTIFQQYVANSVIYDIYDLVVIKYDQEVREFFLFRYFFFGFVSHFSGWWSAPVSVWDSCAVSIASQWDRSADNWVLHQTIPEANNLFRHDNIWDTATARIYGENSIHWEYYGTNWIVSLCNECFLILLEPPVLLWSHL